MAYPVFRQFFTERDVVIEEWQSDRNFLDVTYIKKFFERSHASNNTVIRCLRAFREAAEN